VIKIYFHEKNIFLLERGNLYIIHVIRTHSDIVLTNINHMQKQIFLKNIFLHVILAY